jgi:hypothetical protein
MRASWAYSEGFRRACESKDVAAELGMPIQAGWFITGTINVSDSMGDANLNIPLSGSKNGGTLHVVAHKIRGDWQFECVELEIIGQSHTIDCLH